MSKSKLELFAGIIDYHPKSIAELAKILKKDQANVLSEIRSLEAIGLINLVKEMEGNRESFRPVSLYDVIVFDFGQKTKRKAG